MLVERVQTLDDPRVAVYRNVKDADLRAGDGLFVVEGRLNVRRLVESPRFRTRSVFLTPTALGGLRDALAGLGEAAPVYVASQDVLNHVVGYHLHRGCLAAGERRPAPEAEDLLAPPGAPSTVVVLEQLTNPDNVGSIFRNAQAFGADAVLLCPRCCDPLYRKALRVSMGATLSVPFARFVAWPEGIGRLRAAGYTVVALDPDPDATPLARAPRPERVALVVGTEGPGLSPAARAGADLRVRIAMAPGVDSLNAGTATGIALHHWARTVE